MNLIESIKTHLRKFTMLCVSLISPQQKTELQENEKNGKFEHEFNKNFYKMNKELIDKVIEVGELIEKSLKTTINYDEFTKLKKLLNDLNIITDEEFNNKLKKLNFKNSDDIFNAIKKYRNTDPIIRININEFLGSLSGATTTTQINIIKEYKRSKK
jgi:hypothetical protein